MQYTIKELWEKGISKNTVYEVLKNSLPFSNEFIKNKRVFNDKDLEIFTFYKDFWLKKAIERFGNSEQVGEGGNIQTVPKQFETVYKQEANSKTDHDIKSLSDRLETVQKQFNDKERELLETIKQKEEVIKVREEQTHKYAMMKVEVEKEKKEWIEKYEQANGEKEQWMSKFYSAKSYMLVLAILFGLSLVVLVLILAGVIKI